MVARGAVFYRISKLILSPILRAYFDVTSEGDQNIPKKGPAIIAANHLSALDSAFIPLVVPRKITYVAKAEYFEKWYSRLIFKAWGQIPLDRSGGSASQAALDQARQVLEEGGLFGIYPEGTRSLDGRLHKGHTGVARLALATGAPVIPTGIRGSFEVMPKGARIPKRGAVHIAFGRPLRYSKERLSMPEKVALRLITDEIMYEIQQLSGQEYVDVYANRRSSEQRSTAGGGTASG
jgi:1-acyl-sn-glycerol-3-phosphate acyltransferase